MTVPSNRPSTGFTLGNHEERIRALEFSPGGAGGAFCGPWYTVGTVGVDGVDALILANPPPYNAPPYIPFIGTWTQALGLNAPVQFMTDGCFVYLHGSPAVGDGVGSNMWTFPVGFRPIFQQPILAILGDGTLGGEADCTVYPTGIIKYVKGES